jgi:hypothetical protein
MTCISGIQGLHGSPPTVLGAKQGYNAAFKKQTQTFNVYHVNLAKNLPGEGGQRDREAAPDG